MIEALAAVDDFERRWQQHLHVSYHPTKGVELDYRNNTVLLFTPDDADTLAAILVARAADCRREQARDEKIEGHRQRERPT